LRSTGSCGGHAFVERWDGEPRWRVDQSPARSRESNAGLGAAALDAERLERLQEFGSWERLAVLAAVTLGEPGARWQAQNGHAASLGEVSWYSGSDSTSGT
jgi:hypothetical protein